MAQSCSDTTEHTPSAVQSPLLSLLIIIEIADFDNPRKEAISI